MKDAAAAGWMKDSGTSSVIAILLYICFFDFFVTAYISTYFRYFQMFWTFRSMSVIYNIYQLYMLYIFYDFYVFIYFIYFDIDIYWFNWLYFSLDLYWIYWSILNILIILIYIVLFIIPDVVMTCLEPISNLHMDHCGTLGFIMFIDGSHFGHVHVSSSRLVKLCQGKAWRHMLWRIPHPMCWSNAGNWQWLGFVNFTC